MARKIKRFTTRIWLTSGRKVQPYLNAMVILLLLGVCVYFVIRNLNLANPEQGVDYVGQLVNLLTMAATLYTARQIILMQKISNMEISQAIYEEDVRIRKMTKKLEGYGDEEQYGMQRLLEDWKRQREQGIIKPFRDLYEQACYEDLREYAYHYEYLGQLIYRNELNFDLTFDTITFPDRVFEQVFDYYQDNVDKARDILVIREEDLADQWLGIEYLYCTYELRRKYNAFEKDSSKKKAYETAKKNWEELYDQMPL